MTTFERMAGLVLLGLSLLGLSLGCESTGAQLSDRSGYFRDPRTRLCFAYWTSFTQSGWRQSVTNVPCTPEVEQLIREERR